MRLSTWKLSSPQRATFSSLYEEWQISESSLHPSPVHTTGNLTQFHSWECDRMHHRERKTDRKRHEHKVVVGGGGEGSSALSTLWLLLKVQMASPWQYCTGRLGERRWLQMSDHVTTTARCSHVHVCVLHQLRSSLGSGIASVHATVWAVAVALVHALLGFVLSGSRVLGRLRAGRYFSLPYAVQPLLLVEGVTGLEGVRLELTSTAERHPEKVLGW